MGHCKAQFSASGSAFGVLLGLFSGGSVFFFFRRLRLFLLGCLKGLDVFLRVSVFFSIVSSGFLGVFYGWLVISYFWP